MRKSSPDSVLNGTLLRTWSPVNFRLIRPHLKHYVPLLLKAICAVIALQS